MEEGKKGLKLTYAHVFGFAVTVLATFSAFFLEVEKLEVLFDFFIQMMKKALLVD